MMSFFTQLSDIEKELYHYRDFFRGKVVFCNCDDPEYSNFWKYFQMNFVFLGLKRWPGLRDCSSPKIRYNKGHQKNKRSILCCENAGIGLLFFEI